MYDISFYNLWWEKTKQQAQNFFVNVSKPKNV